MTRFKDFGSGTATKEPLTFKLHGEEFTAKPAIQGKVLLDFAISSADENPAASAAIIPVFFSKVLVPESYKRFETLLDSDKIVEVETLAEIVSWLMEEYTNRPEEPAKG